jgi:fumarate hydratase subunit beta
MMIDTKKLKAGDFILYSGTIYTARDQAHKRLVENIKGGEALPVDLKDQIIYYCGPTPPQPGRAIGSCGPTTSARMDKFTPILIKAGIKAMIGKGRRSETVRKAIKRHKRVYFVTYAGCGALLSRAVVAAEQIAYHDLGPEAIYRLEVENFPLVVGIDCRGHDIFDTQRRRKGGKRRKK